MSYENCTPFDVNIQGAVAWGTFGDPPFSIRRFLADAADLKLADALELDHEITVGVSQFAHPESRP